MINNEIKKQNILLILEIFVLVGMVGAVTYAFFNYTRTGDANTLRLGDITFNTSERGRINLSNAFHIMM